MTVTHCTAAELDAAVAAVEASAADFGTVEMIVRRPAIDTRQELDTGVLVVGAGLEGDNYLERGSATTVDGAAHPEAQLNIMNAAAIDAVSAGDRTRWSLAGDQLFVDLDLSPTNLPTGTRLEIGEAIIEVTAKPHNGCAKFSARFGIDAARWVNSRPDLRLRGINAAVVRGGRIRTGDTIRKLN